ncbi:hypothetical protein Slin15195_G105410 [Septoria linicola]|uniref:Uncharacterized protein n=1 Tax=Septoria linicola TaxID=215465 RepID=A0A9Q9B4J1_9PEZI|nr:hypothetical protein Slin15195_G105410 [Septoria linicola]
MAGSRGMAAVIETYSSADYVESDEALEDEAALIHRADIKNGDNRDLITEQNRRDLKKNYKLLVDGVDHPSAESVPGDAEPDKPSQPLPQPQPQPNVDPDKDPKPNPDRPQPDPDVRPSDAPRPTPRPPTQSQPKPDPKPEQNPAPNATPKPNPPKGNMPSPWKPVSKVGKVFGSIFGGLFGTGKLIPSTNSAPATYNLANMPDGTTRWGGKINFKSQT